MTSDPLCWQVLEVGARAWPDIELDSIRVRDYLDSRRPPLSAETTPYAADLFLACACLAGDPKAQQHLETLCRSCLRFVSRRLKVTLDPDELTATILAMLLVAAPGAAPTLGQYAGRSELKRWLEVVIGHEALKLERKQARADSLQDALLEAMVSDGLVEWKEMDAATRQSFKQALVRALEGLSARDRSLLHLRLDGWNMADMATLFHVRHTTISRWLARVNVAVDHAVRRELRESLRLDGSDFESLVRSFLSRMDSSIRCQVSRACGGEER